MEIVFFLYGLAFVLLGIVILVQPKKESAYSLVHILWLLGLFGLTHGVQAWLDLQEYISGITPNLKAASTLLLASSYFFLFDFGRRLIRLCAESLRYKSLILNLTGRWIYIPLGVAMLFGMAGMIDFWQGLEIWSKYMFGFTGSLLTGIGFLLYKQIERPIHFAMTGYFITAGLIFLLYSVFSGLIPQRGDFFPANVLNEQTFLSATHIPVQVFRALCAVIASFAMGNIVRIFNFETNERLHTALESVQRTLSRVRELSRMNKIILETAGEGIIGIDKDCKAVFTNPTAQNMLGYTVEELSSGSLHDLIHHTSAEGNPILQEQCPICSVIKDPSTPHSDKECFWRKDSTRFPIEYITTQMRDEDGTIIGAVIAFRDISARLAVEKHMRLAEQVNENSPEGILITDAIGTILSVNPAFERSSGYTADEIIGKTPNFLKSEHHDDEFYKKLWEQLKNTGQWQGEIWNRRKDGYIYPEWLNISSIRDFRGKITNYIAIYSNISAQFQLQERLHHLAYYDALTALPNRQLFNDRLRQTLIQAQREQYLVAVMFLDLDRFKNINDTLGHGVGDRLLVVVAARLKKCVRQGDTIARIGGDEFIILLPDIHDPQNADMVAKKIQAGFEKPFYVENQSFQITSSIGISLYPHDGEDIENLIKNADTAMYRAKESGRNNYQFYTPQMSERFQERVALENDLRNAIAKKEIYLVYQPQIDIRTGHIVGIEALVRWRHPKLGELLPSQFIPIAEETGLIQSLGEWILRTACIEAKEWINTGNQYFRLAVNLSWKQIERSGFVELLGVILKETGLNPDWLELELTENTLMKSAESTLTTLKALNNQGVLLSIDNFGTGYSSLSHLKKLSIDKLKIDHSFVHNIPADANSIVITSTIIAMAHSLNLKVIAQGVETQEQLNFLQSLGCDEMQGDLFLPPMPAGDIVRLFTGKARAHGAR